MCFASDSIYIDFYMSDVFKSTESLANLLTLNDTFYNSSDKLGKNNFFLFI